LPQRGKTEIKEIQTSKPLPRRGKIELAKNKHIIIASGGKTNIINTNNYTLASERQNEIKNTNIKTIAPEGQNRKTLKQRKNGSHIHSTILPRCFRCA
jgi:hypothetical protein